jgi:DNA (cytosine-5)-methyltransferase 1
MATSKKSTGKKLKDPTSSVAVTRVSLSVRQVNGEVKKIQGICGHGSEQPLASYDPDTQSWKMFGDISLWGDCPLLVNLPVSGMTRSGVLFLQHPWEPITAETALSSWPTPTTQETEHPDAVLTETGRRLSKDGKTSHSLGLADAARLWPTPTAVSRPMEDNVRLYRAKVQAGEMTEAEAEAILGKSVWQAQGKLPATWPTPTVDDASNVNPKPNRFRGLVAAVNETWPTPTASDWKSRGPNSKQQGLPEVMKTRENLWPTPTTVDTFTPKSRGNPTLGDAARTADSSTGKLNPTWVEWLMGFPLGWTDLEA